MKPYQLNVVPGSREQILAQIAALLEGVSGLAGFYRDRGDFQEFQLPAVLLLDGSEELVSEILPRKTVYMPPAIMRLQPEIFVLLKRRDDASNLTVNDGVAAPIGPEISFWRDLVLSTLINDSVLAGLLTTTGQIVYRGCQTDMATGRTLYGELQLFVDFHYVWEPPAPF
jgi:hypothetical protein